MPSITSTRYSVPLKLSKKSISSFLTGEKPVCGVLAKLSSMCDVKDVLGGNDKRMTFFAPTDDAFLATAKSLGYKGGKEGVAAFFAAACHSISKRDPTTKTMASCLSRLIKYHVVEDMVSFVGMKKGQKYKQKTLSGDSFEIQKTEKDHCELHDTAPNLPNPHFSLGASVYYFKNGYVHTIDKVMWPFPRIQRKRTGGSGSNGGVVTKGSGGSKKSGSGNGGAKKASGNGNGGHGIVVTKGSGGGHISGSKKGGSKKTGGGGNGGRGVAANKGSGGSHNSGSKKGGMGGSRGSGGSHGGNSGSWGSKESSGGSGSGNKGSGISSGGNGNKGPGGSSSGSEAGSGAGHVGKGSGAHKEKPFDRNVTESSPSPTPSASPSPSPSPSPKYGIIADNKLGNETDATPTPPPDSSSTCFPAHAMVYLEDGSRMSMSKLQVGHRVEVGNGRFSDVFAFSHADDDRAYSFMRIDTDGGHSLLATASHFIYINGAVKAAGDAKIGDYLTRENGARQLVVSVSQEVHVGLFNPQTLHGDIVVDGFLSTTYTTAIEPRAASILLGPVRTLYHFGLPKSLLTLPKGGNRVADWCFSAPGKVFNANSVFA